MAMRAADTQAFAAAAVAASHLGRSPGLVEEDQAFGIEIKLASNQTSRRIRMSGRSYSAACAVFFARDGVAGEEAPDRAVAEGHDFVGGRLAFDRHVGRRFKEIEDRVFVCLNPSGPAVSALGTGAASPRSRSSARHWLTLAALTPNRSRACRWLKPCATVANIRARTSSDRALGMSAGLHPADSLNHLNPDSGIPPIQSGRPPL
jgi:hypothetical protein